MEAILDYLAMTVLPLLEFDDRNCTVLQFRPHSLEGMLVATAQSRSISYLGLTNTYLGLFYLGYT